ncbi:hypothetical protein JHK87_009200 [Glycine soja]|nr:hypothetical protein JHK87_009200 [Glycine soja]
MAKCHAGFAAPIGEMSCSMPRGQQPEKAESMRIHQCYTKSSADINSGGKREEDSEEGTDLNIGSDFFFSRINRLNYFVSRVPQNWDDIVDLCAKDRATNHGANVMDVDNEAMSRETNEGEFMGLGATTSIDLEEPNSNTEEKRQALVEENKIVGNYRHHVASKLERVLHLRIYIIRVLQEESHALGYVSKSPRDVF